MGTVHNKPAGWRLCSTPGSRCHRRPPRSAGVDAGRTGPAPSYLCVPHSRPGSGRSGRRIRFWPTAARRLVSLISSLIHLRPGTFGVQPVAQTAEATDPPELRRTHTHRLGKRVGGSSRSRLASSAAQAPGVRPSGADPALCGQDGQPSEPRHRSNRANGFANNEPGPSRTRTD